MPYFTSVEPIGFKRGVAKGIAQGITQGIAQDTVIGLVQGTVIGQRSLILRLLHRQVGTLPDALQSQVAQLSVTQLEALGEALLDFSALADLEQWLSVAALT